MLIDYEDYLDGELWPSESARPTVSEAGIVDPDLKPVFDMPPNYAASALHKLIRWARDGGLNERDEYEREKWVRSSKLGRVLARKCLGIEDFELYSEHGLDRDPLSNIQVAKVFCRELLNIAELDPMAAARLSTDVAVALNNEGYLIFKES